MYHGYSPAYTTSDKVLSLKHIHSHNPDWGSVNMPIQMQTLITLSSVRLSGYFLLLIRRTSTLHNIIFKLDHCLVDA